MKWPEQKTKLSFVTRTVNRSGMGVNRLSTMATKNTKRHEKGRRGGEGIRVGKVGQPKTAPLYPFLRLFVFFVAILRGGQPPERSAPRVRDLSGSRYPRAAQQTRSRSPGQRWSPGYGRVPRPAARRRDR